MERAKVLENIFTVMSVCFYILVFIELSITGAAESSVTLTVNQTNFFFAISFMIAAFIMRMKGSNHTR